MKCVFTVYIYSLPNSHTHVNTQSNIKCSLSNFFITFFLSLLFVSNTLCEFYSLLSPQTRIIAIKINDQHILIVFANFSLYKLPIPYARSIQYSLYSEWWSVFVCVCLLHFIFRRVLRNGKSVQFSCDSK